MEKMEEVEEEEMEEQRMTKEKLRSRAKVLGEENK